MVDQRIIDYINQNIAQGYNADQIRQSLIAAGWNEKDVNEAITQITGQVVIPTANEVEKNISKTPQIDKKLLVKFGFPIILVVIFLSVISYNLFIENAFNVPEKIDTKENQKLTSQDEDKTVTKDKETISELKEKLEETKELQEQALKNTSTINKDCKILANALQLDMKVGDSKAVFVTGVKGEGDNVEWELENSLLATIIPRGTTAIITAVDVGFTTLTASDLNIDDCQYKIGLNIEEGIVIPTTNSSNQTAPIETDNQTNST